MVYCELCGSKHEESDKFCSKCGFNLHGNVVVPPQEDLMSSPPKSQVEFSSPGLLSKPRFVSPHDSRSVPPNSRFGGRRHGRPGRSGPKHTGWILGFAFLGIALVFSFVLLGSVIGSGHGGPFSSFGDRMGDFGGSCGDFFGGFGETMGDFGGRIGDFFGGIGGHLGDTFGGFGDSIGDSFDNNPEFGVPLFILNIFGRLFLLGFCLFVVIFFVSRHRARQRTFENE